MSHRYTSFLLPVLAVLTLGACSPLSKLESKDTQEASDFSTRLAAEYLAYARSEAEQGQKEDADYYAQKGLRATKGEQVDPEAVPDTLKSSNRKRYDLLTKQRMRLMRDLTDDVKKVSPQIAARTQLLYDCWVDQQSENDQDDIVVSCREEYNASIRDLEKSMHNLKPAPKSASKK